MSCCHSTSAHEGKEPYNREICDATFAQKVKMSKTRMFQPQFQHIDKKCSLLVIINSFGTGRLVSELSQKCKNFERLGPGEKMYKNSQFLVFCNALYLNNGKKLYPI